MSHHKDLDNSNDKRISLIKIVQEESNVWEFRLPLRNLEMLYTGDQLRASKSSVLHLMFPAFFSGNRKHVANGNRANHFQDTSYRPAHLRNLNQLD